MARIIPQKSPPLAVPRKSSVPSPSNFAVDWKPNEDGAGELTIAYEGPLAGRNEKEIFARCGIWREGGGPWSETREIQLRRETPGRYLGSLKLPPGSPLRAVELALRIGDDIWDNGGRAPLGYYEWKVGENRIEVV